MYDKLNKEQYKKCSKLFTEIPICNWDKDLYNFVYKQHKPMCGDDVVSYIAEWILKNE